MGIPGDEPPIFDDERPEFGDKSRLSWIALSGIYAAGLGLAMQTAFPGVGVVGNLAIALTCCVAALACWLASYRADRAMIRVAACYVAGNAAAMAMHVILYPNQPVMMADVLHRAASHAAMTLPALLFFIWGLQAERLLHHRLGVQEAIGQARRQLAESELVVVSLMMQPETMIQALRDAGEALDRGSHDLARSILERLARDSRERMMALGGIIPPLPIHPDMVAVHHGGAPLISRPLPGRQPMLLVLGAWEVMLVATSLIEAFILRQSWLQIMVFVHIVGWFIAFGAMGTARLIRKPVDAMAPIAGGLLTGNLVGKALAGFLVTGSPWFLFMSPEGRAVMPFSLFFGFSGAIIVWSYGVRRRASVALARTAFRGMETDRLLSSVRLKALQAQIEPHFLFNTLSNIIAQTRACPVAARNMLDVLTRMLERLGGRHPVGTLQDELDAIRDYLVLQSLRIGPRLSWDIACPDALLSASFPTLLIQPLVENAIRHGVEMSAGNHAIHVGIALYSSHRLMVEVTDTGKGFSGSGKMGIGLRNIRDRLRTLYGNEGIFELRRESSGGLCARLIIPLFHQESKGSAST